MHVLLMPVSGRKVLAVLSVLTAVAAAYFGRCFIAGMPVSGTALIFASGAFAWAGRRVWSSRSPEEVSPAEIESARRAGVEIVLEARWASLAMFGATAVYFTFASGMLTVVGILPTVMALVLALHVYPRAYPKFEAPVPAPWIESLPAAETPAPNPEPVMLRLLARKEEVGRSLLR